LFCLPPPSLASSLLLPSIPSSWVMPSVPSL
jgi:hypothetical protein